MPNGVKLFKLTVVSPVFVIADIAVKRASIKLIGTVLEKGRRRSIVPMVIVASAEKIITLLGER